MNNTNTARFKTQVRKNPLELPKHSVWRLERQGKNHAEAVYVAKKPKQGIKKISKTEYQVIKTGEIRKFSPTEKKQRDSLQKTFNNLRALIRTNFSQNKHNQKFITLTFKDQPKDLELCFKYFKIFMRDLKRAFKELKFEYIVVAEPHESGAWHFHLMLKADKAFWIDKEQLTKIWKRGATQIKELKSDDVGAYYVSYFTDLIQGEDEITLESKENPEINKKRIKGKRLEFYPKGAKFFSCSRGITRPTKQITSLEAIEVEFGQAKHSSSFDIVSVDDEGEAIETMNSIEKRYYNKERTKKRSD